MSKVNAIDHCLYMQTGVRAYYSAHFGQGVGDIHSIYVGCTGTESELLNCPYIIPSASSCNHYADAGVRCPGKVHVCYKRAPTHKSAPSPNSWLNLV